MDDIIDSWLRGYSHEQYAEALYQTLLNYLQSKGVMDMKEYEDYAFRNFETILKKIVERDRKEVKEKYGYEK